MSLLWSEYCLLETKSNYFFLLSNRIFELGIGVLCAHISFFYKKQYIKYILSNLLLCDLFAFLGIISIIISFFIFDDYSSMPGILSLIPTIGTAVFILTIREKTILSQIMIFKYFVGLGKISYILYLWHFPLIIFLPNLKNSIFIYISILLLIILSFLT